MERKIHKGEDGVFYDEDGYPVYTSLSPFSEEEDESDEDES